MKKIKIIGFVLFVLLLVGATTLLQQKDYNKLIIGTWLPQGDGYEYRWVFTKNGKCYDYYDNALDATYTYTIQSEKSVNGKFTIWYLKLTNINDLNDIYEYDIIGLSKDTMRLDYAGNLNTKLSVFIKQ